MLYTFEGSLTTEDINGTPSDVNYDVEYNFLIDFDEPALRNGNLHYDRMEDGVGFLDFGSVTLESEDGLYYNNEVVEYTMLSVLDVDFIPEGGVTEIFIYGYDSYGVRTNLLQIISTDTDGGLIVGKDYSVTEFYNDYPNFCYTATGNIELTSITDPYQSVPEPGLMALMFSGILAVSGLGFRRKK
jgi:hypothetical protein